MSEEETRAAAGRRKPHAIVVPFPLQGHVIPAVHLAIKLASQDRRDDTISYIPGVDRIELKDIPSPLQEARESTIVHQITFAAFEEARCADFVLINTIEELERDTIASLKEVHSAKVHAVGPIFPPGFTTSPVSTSLWAESDCTQWLNSRTPGSVLYVSFGSYAHVAKHDLVEIARGLALSQVSFLWVLRDDIVSSDDPDPLPVGFREEVSDRGMIVGWCSQKEVLAHVAIGGFLTHCGWNSIHESMWCGVPMLCFPLFVDQFTNRKLVVDDWRVGINLVDQMVVTNEEVSRNVSRLMGGKSREEFKERIDEMKKIMVGALEPSGSSEQNFGQFVRELKNKISIKM
ncbi:UDP-glycosyltransferase 86A1 [Linum perenne]